MIVHVYSTFPEAVLRFSLLTNVDMIKECGDSFAVINTDMNGRNCGTLGSVYTCTCSLNNQHRHD